MKKNEFHQKILGMKDKIGIWRVSVGEKNIGQFTLGYYWEDSLRAFIVYEVNERQHVREWAKLDTEEEALNELYDLIKYRLWID